MLANTYQRYVAVIFRKKWIFHIFWKNNHRNIKATRISNYFYTNKQEEEDDRYTTILQIPGEVEHWMKTIYNIVLWNAPFRTNLLIFTRHSLVKWIRCCFSLRWLFYILPITWETPLKGAERHLVACQRTDSEFPINRKLYPLYGANSNSQRSDQ